MVNIKSWGRLESGPCEVVPLINCSSASRLIKGNTPGLPFGKGRSYGDVCLNPNGRLWTTDFLDHFISFDINTGLLECEAGVLLRDIQRTFVPRGWMLPVTPGTQVVTVGGAIANDIHGKNHHVHGSFGNHIQLLKLQRTAGELLVCGPNQNASWFAATVGGLGLTGVILSAQIQLKKIDGPWLDVETIPYQNLTEFFALADESEAGWEHTVSWVDCAKKGSVRGIFMRANHANLSNIDAPLTRSPKVMPFTPPISLVNRYSLRPFNALYYNVNVFKAGSNRVHYEPFSYPLDNLLEWNRMYGPTGFYQYQSVVPREYGFDAVKSMIAEISRSDEGSFLAVLKTFGRKESVGLLSFARPGVTLALDFPNKGSKTLELFSRLDDIVRHANGCIYPAKDARMPIDLFKAGYPNLPKFMDFRDPGISSALSRRLMGY